MVYLDGVINTWHGGGGVAVYFAELISFFQSVGLDYKYLNFDGRSDDYSVPLRRRPFERYRKMKYLFDAGSVFHSSYYRIPCDDTIPVVTTVHDFIYEKTAKGLKRFVHSAQKKSAIQRSSKIICVSNNTRNDFFEFFPKFPKDDVIVVNNGVSDSFNRYLVKPPASDLESYVVYVGSRAWYKNFKQTVDAVGMLKNTILVIVGGGALTPKELGYIKSRLGKNFKHFTRLTTEELNSVYGNAQCLIYPSSYEGFGIPVLEAMRAGCPVVAVKGSSITEVAGGHAFLADSPNPNELANIISEVLNLTSRERIVQSAYDWSLNFTWKKTGAETLKVYNSIFHL